MAAAVSVQDAVEALRFSRIDGVAPTVPELQTGDRIVSSKSAPEVISPLLLSPICSL